MLRVVETQTPHRADVLKRQRRQQKPDVGHAVRHVVLAEDVARDDAGLLGLANVGDATGQDGVAVVGAAVLG